MRPCGNELLVLERCVSREKIVAWTKRKIAQSRGFETTTAHTSHVDHVHRGRCNRHHHDTNQTSLWPTKKLLYLVSTIVTSYTHTLAIQDDEQFLSSTSAPRV